MFFWLTFFFTLRNRSVKSHHKWKIGTRDPFDIRSYRRDSPENFFIFFFIGRHLYNDFVSSWIDKYHFGSCLGYSLTVKTNYDNLGLTHRGSWIFFGRFNTWFWTSFYPTSFKWTSVTLMG